MQPQTRDAVEVAPVPDDQRQVVAQGRRGNQQVEIGQPHTGLTQRTAHLAEDSGNLEIDREGLE